MPKPAIPAVPNSAKEHGRVAFDNAVKANLEILSGLRGGRIAELDVNASTSDILQKLNEIIARLQ